MSLIQRAVTNPRIVVIASVVFTACTWLVLSSFQTVGLSLPSRPFSYATSKSHTSLSNLFQALHTPSIRPDDPVYTSYGGKQWTLPAAAMWRQNLGKKLCIIDLDSRERDEEGGLFNQDPMSWDVAQGLSTGTLNHYLYAKIHGYTFYYIRSDVPSDRRPSWRKPPIIKKLLKQHDICIYLDSDAIFNHLELPFEWLLNYWQFEPGKISMAMATDPVHPDNQDKFKRVNVNSGFIINQNIPRTYEILDAWEGCPEPDSKYENCTDFRHASLGRPTDQAAFSTFIRYDFNKPTDIKELSCTEANGYPASHSGCNGEFIRHFWTGKEYDLKGGVGEGLSGAFLQWGHEDLLMSKNQYFRTETDIGTSLPASGGGGN